MKRYLAFAGDDYYPTGGWGDFVAASDDLDECVRLAKCFAAWLVGCMLIALKLWQVMQ